MMTDETENTEQETTSNPCTDVPLPPRETPAEIAERIIGVYKEQFPNSFKGEG